MFNTQMSSTAESARAIVQYYLLCSVTERFDHPLKGGDAKPFITNLELKQYFHPDMRVREHVIGGRTTDAYVPMT